MKFDRFIDVFVNWHLLAGAIECPVSVVAVFNWQWRIGDHIVGEMPFSKMCGSVPLLLQEPGQQRCAGAKPIGHATFGVVGHPCEVPIDFITSGKVPRHHGRPAWRTDSAGDGESVEIRAFGGESIDVRRLHVGMIVAA